MWRLSPGCWPPRRSLPPPSSPRAWLCARQVCDAWCSVLPTAPHAMPRSLAPRFLTPAHLPCLLPAASACCPPPSARALHARSAARWRGMQGTRTQCRGNGCGASPPRRRRHRGPGGHFACRQGCGARDARGRGARSAEAGGGDGCGWCCLLARCARVLPRRGQGAFAVCVHVHDEMCVYIYTAVYIHMHVGYILDSKP